MGSGLTDQDLCEIPGGGAVCMPILDRSDALDGFDPDDVEILISVKGAEILISPTLRCCSFKCPPHWRLNIWRSCVEPLCVRIRVDENCRLTCLHSL